MMAVTFAVALRSASTAWWTPRGASASPWSPWSAWSARSGTASPRAARPLLAASVIWGLRLAAYIGWRNQGKAEDPRYRDLLSRAKGNKNLYALRTIYLLQALILWVATLPVQAGMLERAPAGPVTIIGAVVWLGGFVFESVGDWQLARFKADPAHKRPDHGPRPVAVHPPPQLLR